MIPQKLASRFGRLSFFLRRSCGCQKRIVEADESPAATSSSRRGQYHLFLAIDFSVMHGRGLLGAQMIHSGATTIALPNERIAVQIDADIACQAVLTQTTVRDGNAVVPYSCRFRAVHSPVGHAGGGAQRGDPGPGRGRGSSATAFS